MNTSACPMGVIDSVLFPTHSPFNTLDLGILMGDVYLIEFALLIMKEFEHLSLWFKNYFHFLFSIFILRIGYFSVFSITF